MCCFNCPFILELNYMCAPILGARRAEIQTHTFREQYTRMLKTCSKSHSHLVCSNLEDESSEFDRCP